MAVGFFGFEKVVVERQHGLMLLAAVSVGRNCRSLTSFGMTILIK
jgi:hypothetical protein